MPLVFNVQLVCDAEGCESSQDGVAHLDPEALMMLGVLPLLTNPTTPFTVMYDKSVGLDWKVYRGKAACSPPCHAAVEAMMKKEKAP